MPACARKYQPSCRRASGGPAQRTGATSAGEKHPILSLQRSIGNQAMQRLLQPKLRVSAPGDAFEREADRIALQATSRPRLQRGGAGPGAGVEERVLPGRRIGGGSGGLAPPVVHGVLRSPGQPLDPATRGFMEARLGSDFGHVRVHSDARAAESAEAVDALAYTVGRDIAFGAGRYSPRTPAGSRLLAHELTHVVQQRAGVSGEAGSASTLQRQGGGAGAGAAVPAHLFPFTTSGCGVAPFVEADVVTAANAAFDAVKNTNCVKTDYLRDSILAEFDGLTIECEQGTGKPCGRAWRYFTQTLNLYPEALDPGCDGLESTILHEVVHLAERSLIYGSGGFHGELSWACEASCLGTGSGDPDKCTSEGGLVPSLGVSRGLAFPSRGAHTGYLRLYTGLETRRPVLGVFYPSFGIGVAMIGESTTGEPGSVPSGSSTLVSLSTALRLDPGRPGGVNLSISGGPALAGGSELGAEAGVAFGLRWSIFDISLDAGLGYDPTRETGLDKFYTLGATLRIGPALR